MKIEGNVQHGGNVRNVKSSFGHPLQLHLAFIIPWCPLVSNWFSAFWHSWLVFWSEMICADWWSLSPNQFELFRGEVNNRNTSLKLVLYVLSQSDSSSSKIVIFWSALQRLHWIKRNWIELKQLESIKWSIFDLIRMEICDFIPWIFWSWNEWDCDDWGLIK
jgi:hypothetical protein